jgi:diguanylate cyclase (GGDEF)-like protein/PAS domain S-box-containing protein
MFAIKPQDKINFFKSLAYRLLRVSLAIAVIFGLLSAFVQVYFDYSEQHNVIDDRVNEAFRVSGSSAQHAVHLLDNRMADEVVKGMRNYDYINKVTIYDDADKKMAEFIAQPSYSKTEAVTKLLSNSTREYSYDLRHTDGVLEGRFVLEVNVDKALAPFYDRVLTIFISGFFRNAGLTFVLMGLYYLLLTRPLVNIAKRVTLIDPQKTEKQRIEFLDDHQEDELGAIVIAVNDLLSTLETEKLNLLQRGKQLSLILDSSPNLIYAADQSGNFVFLNQATADFYNTSIEELIGENCYRRHKSINVNEAKNLLVSQKQAETSTEAYFESEQERTDSNGLKHIVQVNYVPFDFYGELCVLIIANDITGRVQAEKRIENLAYFDTLTGLPNRNLLYDRVSMDISRCKRKGTFGAFLFIDLDEFKRVNDTMGHSVGDQLLLTLSKSMKEQIRETDTLARMGGDEFTLSMPDLSEDFDVAQSQAAELAGRLLVKLSQSIMIGNNEFNISASIGVVIYPRNDEDTETLIRFADTAMYKAKDSGRNAYMIFEQSMAIEADRLIKLDSELRIAAKEGQFVFYLQPLVDAKTKSLAGAEALVRWDHPEKGILSPINFLDFLESSGLISDVDSQVFSNVCLFAAEHYKQGRLPKDFRFSVNLSAKVLHRLNFVEDVKATLLKYDLPAKFIEFEITESAALLNLEEVVQKILELQSLGVTFALDDFGTGYSSLSYLKQLPVNKVKIDKSFINDLTVDAQDEAMVASVVAIARTLNLVTVAEGVETEEQAAWFAQYDNVVFQGYLFDRPLPIEDFSKKYLKETLNRGGSSVVEFRPQGSNS